MPVGGVGNKHVRSRSGKLRPRKNATVKKVVARELNKRVETNKLNYALASTADTTPVVVQLFPQSQGDNEGERSGSNIYLKSVSIRINAICADSTNFVRFIVFQWFPDDTVDSPTSSTILENIGSLVSTYSYIDRQKWDILWDKTFSLTLSGNACATAEKMITNLRERKAFFNPTSATTGKNQIFLLYYSDSAAVVHPSVNAYALLRYTDM